MLRCALLIFLTLLLALLGGCGGSNDTEAAAPTVPAQPTVTAQPTASAPSTADGGAVTLSVGASGEGLAFQWQRNGVDLPGATAATLTLPALSLADDGARLRVQVSNPGGRVTSDEIVLRVTAVAPTITTAPSAATVTEGQPASFSVTTTGSAPVAYQWLRNGVAIAGATAASYTLATAALVDNGASLSVQVSNSGGSVTSAAALLSVTGAPASALGEGTRSLWLAQTHTLALRSDGLLMGWGSNSNAQLGGGAVIAGSPAVQIATGVASASTNTEFGLAIDAAGALRGWGSNSAAWLGGTGSTAHTAPQAVTWPVRGVRQVEAGRGYVLLVDGTVWSRSGQVPSLNDVTALSQGHGDAYAVRADGSVWSLTATNLIGGIGPTSTTLRADPVAGLANVRQIACGTNHCLAVLADGTLRAWGEGRSGELGHGVAASSATPVLVSGLSQVTHVAVTSVTGSSIARTADGKVWSWGRGELSARPSLRTGAFTFPPANSAVPVEVASLAGSTEVACSDWHCAARKADGTVWTWGNNLYGQLGTDIRLFGAVIGESQEPVKVPGVQLDAPGGGAAGAIRPALLLLAVPRPGWASVGQSLSFHASAVGRGTNVSFQWLRNGSVIPGATSAAYTTPPLVAADDGARLSVRVSEGTDMLTSAEAGISVSAAVASLWPAATYTLALRGDGALLGWGSNANRQLGSGAAVPGSAARLVASGMVRASAAPSFGLAIDAQGGFWGWGADSDVWLGGPVPTSGAVLVNTPVAAAWPVRRVRQAEAMLMSNSSTWQNSFVLLADGTVWQLPGDRVTSGTSATHSAVQVPGLYDITVLSQGHGLPHAVRSDGSVWAIGTVISSGEPGWFRPYATAVAGLANVRRITCGRDHCLALLADGSVRAWGQGTRGQLGHAAASNSSVPVVVAGLSGVTHIAVASAQGASFARTADGKVYSWGAGELSARARAGTLSGVPADALQPVEITTLAGSAEVSCSPSHCVVRKSDGSVWGWGGNSSGELGSGNTTAAQVPQVVPGVSLN